MARRNPLKGLAPDDRSLPRATTNFKRYKRGLTPEELRNWRSWKDKFAPIPGSGRRRKPKRIPGRRYSPYNPGNPRTFRQNV